MYAVVPMVQQGKCPDMTFLWSHTYDHRRFVEHTPACVVIQGTVNNSPNSDEGDGDLHFNVTPDNTPDKRYENLLNKNNTKGLVVEVICWDAPKPSYKAHGNYCQDVHP